jgi:trehalose synthase
LLLAGPNPAGVADDPEASSSFAQLCDAWRRLPAGSRSRVHLCCLPVVDAEQNAAIVNAIQRRSDVVVQKSLAEGFGLTVAEAMWKKRPVVGSRVGGIQDQITDGVTGLLVTPTDDADFARAITRLLTDQKMSARLGAAAHARVNEEYLAPCFLTRYLQLVEQAPSAAVP